MTNTSAEAVERIRKYIDYPHTSPETVVLDSDLVRITASDLRALLAERDELTREFEVLHKAGIVEIAARNPSVMEYMKHWECRDEKAEAERDELQAQLEKACRLAEAVSKQTAGNGTQVISPETAAALADFNKARGEG